MSEERAQDTTTSRVLTVEVDRHSAGRSVIHVSGDMLCDATEAVGCIVSGELRRSPALVVLDLSAVTRIDASGIATLVSAATQAGESDISLCLVGMQGRPVEAALADADLTELFETFPAVTDA